MWVWVGVGVFVSDCMIDDCLSVSVCMCGASVCVRCE